MHTTNIHGTDLSPSSLCMGTGDMGGTLDREQSFLILDTFTGLGGTFLDSAKIYNDWIPGEKSRSEKMVGAWMKSRGSRSNIFIGTKGAHFNLETPQVPRLSPEEIRFDLDASLSHLQTDWIDLYWLHRDDPNRPVEEIIQTLESQVQAGKIRYYGLSNWRANRLIEAVRYSKEHGCQGFSAVQNMWSLAEVNSNGIADPTMVAMDHDLLNFHRAYQVTAIPYTSQANGLFQKMAANQHTPLPMNLQRTYGCPANDRRLQNILALQNQTGLSISQIVLGYLLSQPFPTIPVFSTRNLQHLEETMTAADVRLSEEQVAFLLS